MIGLLILVGLALVVLAGAAAAETARMRICSQGSNFGHGLLVVIFRWHLGHPWHGRPLTDAGWSRPATRALTPTGHAKKFWHLPRRRRAASRSLRSAVVLLAVIGLLADFWLALWLLAACSVAGVAFGIRYARLAWQRKSHHQTWLSPLHHSLAGQVGHPLALSPADWIVLAEDRSSATLALPEGAHYTPSEKKEIEATVTERLGNGYQYRWQQRGPMGQLEVSRLQPPPARVTLADVQAVVDATSPDELVLGIGQLAKPVSASLALDSPHWGISGGSGAGKSALIRMIIAQHLHKGGIAVFLDCKMISHHWAQGLPNAVFAVSTAQCHTMLLGMGVELNRRNRVAYAGADIEGNVTGALVGDRIMVVVEEMNSLIGRLKAFWSEQRTNQDPRMSPALASLFELGFMGRQVLINLLMAAQRLSVNSLGGTGGGDLRENLGVRLLWNPSPSTWKMLAEDFPQPPPNKAKGRFYVVTDCVTEVQVAYLGAREARDYAMSGRVAARPGWMFTATPPPWAVADSRPAPETPPAAIALPAPEQAMNHVSAVPGPEAVSNPLDELVTLREAVDSGLVRMRVAGLRTARARGQLPPHASYRGDAQVWRAGDLIEFDERRRAA